MAGFLLPVAQQFITHYSHIAELSVNCLSRKANPNWSSMPADNFDQDVPKLVLDEEDREAYLRQRQPSKQKSAPAEVEIKPVAKQRNGLAWLALLLAIGAGARRLVISPWSVTTAATGRLSGTYQ
ncbi:hypothetical protein ACFQMB_01875 [Pseudobowmanella zhangzhouensis]|uniref:hypothetical protein n=1 Tax=Pseudobowmanella zhangzhouensis TaxID=1537679 RepID=UPI00361925E1